MKIYTDIKNLKLKNPVVTTGTFDGIHMGHFSIIDLMKRRANEMDGETVLFTFWPHPRFVVGEKKNGLKLLNTLEEKKILFERSGIDNLIIFPFTKEFAGLSSREFVKDILVESIGVKHLVFGYDHHFGKNREGSFESLQECAGEFGFTVEQVKARVTEGENISSTKIRQLLGEGNVKEANKFLGYEYYMNGKVVDGLKIGRKIGFPTANIQPLDEKKLIPPVGVYAVSVKLNGEKLPGMMNIGYRPTIEGDNKRLSIEVHIIDFEGDIYNNQIEVWFNSKIRDEIKFENVEELTKQLEKDRLSAIKALNYKKEA